MASEDSDSDSVDQPTNNILPSFSFSGCGFLGVYHVGVAACLRDHTDILRRREIKFAGASAGALVTASFLCDLDFGEMTKLLLIAAKAIRNGEPIDLACLLKDLMNQYLPDDAHLRLRNRLYISLTIINGIERALVTNFHSKEHLIQCLIASSFIPGFVGWIPPLIEADDFLDISSGFPATSFSEDSGSDTGEDEQDGDREVQRGGYRRPSSDTFHEHEEWPYSSNDSGKDEIYPIATKKRKEKDSYLKMLLRLCFFGIKTTSRIIRQVPGAAQIIDHVAPQIFGELDGLVEAIVQEVMSNRYAVFDGGFSDNIPSFDSNTITVCPFAGESDICPRDLTAIDINIDLGRTSMQVTEDNIFRLNYALYPMDPEMLLKLCEEGYNECLRFLNRTDLLSCKKHLMTRATISSSPCNIGHAHCHCHICKSADSKIRTSLSCIKCHKRKQKALKSVLPDDVRFEFERAIEEQKKQQTKKITESYWSSLVSALWWCVEKMYANTIKMADLSIDFHLWLMRFWDNIACIARFAILPLGKKRKLARMVLASLRNSINTSMRMRLKKSCTLQEFPPMCS